MKVKIFYILLIALVLAGCNRSPHYKIGVSQCSDDDWRRKMNSEIEREVLFHPEVEIEIRSANDDSQKQIEDIEYFIDNKFDAIIVAPNEADALTPIISNAYNSGIPVVLFDRNIHGNDYSAWQGADNVAIGVAAGQLALLQAGDGAKVIELRGLKGSTPADERRNGFHSVAGINVVADGYGNWTYEAAYPLMDSLMAAHPDVQVIFAHNDRMAIAASDVARQRGLSPYIIGIDGAPEIGMKAVKDSVIDATFIYPTEGQRVIQTALKIINGEDFDTITILAGAGAITPSNVDALLLQNHEIQNETSRMETLKGEIDDYWEQHSSQTALLYAVIVIVLLLAGVLFLLLRTFWQHRRHQNQLNEATASKLAFFTNVSHDLRTPLTLISGPIDEIRGADNLTRRQTALIAIADKNIRILRRLINQILDFRKYENNKLELKLEQANLDELIKGFAESFEELSRRRDIDFSVDIQPNTDFSAATDVEKFERVFYNIVSNAFKFTPDNGSIAISLHRIAGNVILCVKDSGKGISAQDLPLVFDHFFQADTVLPNGSGIGLALSKAFVELLGGSITVESEMGKGALFTVTLPVRKVEANYHGKKRITADDVNAELSDSVILNDDIDIEEKATDKPTVLIIDDNADIRTLVADLLGMHYNVIAAENGGAGLKKAAKYVPDLIICDIMMPEMDGIECCRRLKAEISTSHIPVMMLTACAMDEQRATGYEVGADGYLSKPFNASVLLARVKNLIDNRKLIRELWTSDTIAPSPAQPEKASPRQEKPAGAPDIDSEFYHKFLDLVEQNMGKPELNIEDMAADMGLSRSQFYRKIKSLTNYSPIELLRRLRLKRAYELLTTTEKTISEISYEVGFSTPAYFTKCFKEAYQETPTETRDRLS